MGDNLVERARKETAWGEAESMGYDPAKLVIKRDCRWILLSNKIYRKKLDMGAIRNSQAYKLTGERNPNVAGSRYTLKISLAFIDEELHVSLDNGSTNPWR